MARPNRDSEHLAVLQDYYAKHRLIPSYSAISTLLGFSAKTAGASLVARLEEAGYLRRTPDNRLTPTVRFFERPRSISPVPAGAPETLAEAPGDMVSLDALLVRRPSKTVYLPVKGDSMIDAGLMPGDTAIVERQHTANVNDIVVAIVNDEFTIKRLIKERGRFALKPENKAYATLRPDPLEIYGVVTGSFRSYKGK